MRVTDPDGQTWRVGRRWTPWHWRLRKVDPDAGFDAFDLGDDLVSGIVLGLILLVVAPVLVVTVIAGLEFLLLLLLVPFIVLGRIAFGKQWIVSVRRGWTPWWEVASGDWRASGERALGVADAIARGEPPERTLRPRG
ncbi:hypothetical protein GCM10011519_11700 [Marmoricola endophyticus]|uniref:Uncharacterized protein n=1 Tax=Marmoricola endophyticus TaxID=2040280 RepID=A0A917BH75_9ACTN|nr:hypothetical protein [Marmoricola endophyticus]GGF39699.1 hypothetical protein GCM10011519_11700 [Marmoricola endophyticus]